MLDITSVFKGEFLAGNFVHDAFAIVVPQTPAQLVVVHLRFVLSRSPKLGNLFRLQDSKLVAVACPHDHVSLVWREEKVQ